MPDIGSIGKRMNIKQNEGAFSGTLVLFILVL